MGMRILEEDDEIIIELGNTGIVQEPIKKFPESLFREVYKAAGMLTAKIESEQREIRQKKYTLYGQPDNIITFVGRRGTGKSSSMFSFMDVLKTIQNTEDLNHITEKSHNSIERFPNIEFIVLDWIDASILEKGEDIFEMLLAKMMGEILKEDSDLQEMNTKKEYCIKELNKKLGSIYQKVIKLKLRNTKQVYREESPISSLREYARSIDLRQEFERLIEAYLSIKSKNGMCPQNSFLVVAIDDVDMNINYGFDILEQIQRYLKVNGLLVLLSIDYDQMLQCCEKHFKKVYKDEQKRRQIAETYVTKVLPFNRRVYLPSLKKRDYSRRNKIKVKVGNKKSPIKETMFKMIWEYTKIRYDSQGRKRHFMEFSDLRVLNNYYMFLQGMLTIKQELPSDFPEYKKQNKLLDQNHQRMMDDLLFRFAEEYLPINEKKYFIALSEEDIRSRGELVVANFVRDVAKIDAKDLRYTAFSDKYGSAQIHGFAEETEVFGYSFGQFMRCLYFMGREVIYDKKLAHALLAMYTSAMTRIFYRYLLENRELCREKENGETEKKSAKGKRGNYNMLKTLLGSSAAGSWSLYIMPKIWLSEEEEGFSGATAPMKLPKSGKSFIEAHSIIEEIKKLACKNIENLEDQLSELVPKLQVELMFCMFFSRFSDPESGFKLHVNDNVFGNVDINETDHWKANGDDYICLVNSQGAQFNALEFISNIFAFQDCVRNFVKMLLDLSGITDKKSKEIIADNIVKSLQKTEGFYGQMLKWEQDYGGAVVPFYSVDIYYNLLKRLARKQRQNQSTISGESELYMNLKELLENIKQHLLQSDTFYGLEESKNEAFSKIFEECPFIKFFLDNGIENEDNDLKREREKFMNLYNKLVYDMICKDKAGKRLQKITDKMNFFED